MNYRETEGLYYSKCLRGKYTESSVGMGQGLGPCAKSFGRDAPSKYGKTAKNGQKQRKYRKYRYFQLSRASGSQGRRQKRLERSLTSSGRALRLRTAIHGLPG
jgi:hypothetical protein